MAFVVTFFLGAAVTVYLSPIWGVALAIRKLNTVRKPVANAKERVDRLLEGRSEKGDDGS